jgi:hypothetical protein
VSTVDPWVQVLQQLEPSYFKWKDILEKGPNIIPNLLQKGKWWCITLQEVVPDNSESNPVWSNPGKLDERVYWTHDHLMNWPDVKRMAHDMWHFKRRRDAEKFQTLYNLKWAAE